MGTNNFRRSNIGDGAILYFDEADSLKIGGCIPDDLGRTMRKMNDNFVSDLLNIFDKYDDNEMMDYLKYSIIDELNICFEHGYYDGFAVYIDCNTETNMHLDIHNYESMDNWIGERIENAVRESEDLEDSESSIKNIKAHIYNEIGKVYDQYCYYINKISKEYSSEYIIPGNYTHGVVEKTFEPNKQWDEDYIKYSDSIDSILTGSDYLGYLSPLEILDKMVGEIIPYLKYDFKTIDKALEDRDTFKETISNAYLRQVAKSYQKNGFADKVLKLYDKHGTDYKHVLLREFVENIGDILYRTLGDKLGIFIDNLTLNNYIDGFKSVEKIMIEDELEDKYDSYR